MAFFATHSWDTLWPEELGTELDNEMAYDPSTWEPELDNRKAEAPVLPRQALKALPVMALFAMVGKAEATSRGKGRSWTIRKAQAPV